MPEPPVAPTAPTTAESITQDTTTTATAPVWTDGLPQETLGFVEKKGWKGNADVITSYQNLEKLHGVPAERIIKLPEKLEGAEMGVIYNRLGRPEKTESHKIPVPEGAGADFIAGETAPDFGSGILTPEQAKRKIGLLGEDTDFVKRYTSGNVQAKLEMEQLSKWAYPDPV